MGKFWNWLKAEKAVLGGLLICAVALGAIFTGAWTVQTGGMVFGLGIGLIGLAEKANLHQAQILAALQEVAKIGADYRSGGKQAVVADIKQEVAQAPQVIGEMMQSTEPKA